MRYSLRDLLIELIDSDFRLNMEEDLLETINSRIPEIGNHSVKIDVLLGLGGGDVVAGLQIWIDRQTKNNAFRSAV